MSNKSVSHYSDGRNAWKVGFLGFMLRFKGLAIASCITIISMGVPWWFPANVPDNIQVNRKLLIVLTLLFVGSLSLSLLIYLRKRTIRSLEIKYNLHLIAHEIRDKQTELHESLIPGKNYPKSKLNKELEILLKQICENVANHFKELTGDATIGAAIRLATFSDDKQSIVYKTFARSKNLNSHRKKDSEPIPTNKGIPRFLREDKNAQGILIYHDLNEAEQDATYIKTKNDRKYPSDITTMMVSPLNAWSGRKQDMIGILYVTSRNDNIFKIIHVDSLAFLADLTANSIANTIELVRLKCQNPDLNKGKSYAQNL